MIGSDLSSLYKNRPIVLWVEDPLTRSYLRALWQDPDIGLLVAGGNDAVYGAVRNARLTGYPNVFGFRDRDFIQTNRASWLDRKKNPEVFIPDVLEVENYLLDLPAMAALGSVLNARGVTEAELERKARELATESVWWMSVRAVISAARALITNEFPGHPEWSERTQLSSTDPALLLLRGRLSKSTWGMGLSLWTSRAWMWKWWSDSQRLHHGWIDAKAKAYHDQYVLWLTTNDWKSQWSGKELFEALVEVIYPSPPKSVQQSRKNLTRGQRRAQKLDDVVKGIAARQVASLTVPPDLIDLQKALRKRSGLDSW